MRHDTPRCGLERRTVYVGLRQGDPAGRDRRGGDVMALELWVAFFAGAFTGTFVMGLASVWIVGHSQKYWRSEIDKMLRSEG